VSVSSGVNRHRNRHHLGRTHAWRQVAPYDLQPSHLLQLMPGVLVARGLTAEELASFLYAILMRRCVS